MFGKLPATLKYLKKALVDRLSRSFRLLNNSVVTLCVNHYFNNYILITTY